MSIVGGTARLFRLVDGAHVFGQRIGAGEGFVAFYTTLRLANALSSRLLDILIFITLYIPGSAQ